MQPRYVPPLRGYRAEPCSCSRNYGAVAWRSCGSAAGPPRFCSASVGWNRLMRSGDPGSISKQPPCIAAGTQTSGFPLFLFLFLLLPRLFSPHQGRVRKTTGQPGLNPPPPNLMWARIHPADGLLSKNPQVLAPLRKQKRTFPFTVIDPLRQTVTGGLLQRGGGLLPPKPHLHY
ncbi:hypothetical protein VZT92_003574 [Zoarces viviparus]|uniref:Uncharacterized protein n=1 Tax=Zoarces viviparus TaxID=48416 RepID=A0AAW1FVR2_ZOAVI